MFNKRPRLSASKKNTHLSDSESRCFESMKYMWIHCGKGVLGGIGELDFRPTSLVCGFFNLNLNFMGVSFCHQFIGYEFSVDPA